MKSKALKINQSTLFVYKKIKSKNAKETDLTTNGTTGATTTTSLTC